MAEKGLSLHLKRRLDTLFGKPVLLGLGFSARLLGFLLRRQHTVEPVNTVLVMKFQGIGSLAIALPSLCSLRARYPAAKFIFWGTPATAALAKTVSLFNEIHVLDDASLTSSARSALKTLIRLIPLGIDWAFDLEVYSKMSSVLLTLTCARNRAGFAVDSAGARADCHTHLVFFNRYRYIGESYERLFALLSRSPLSPPANIPWTQPLTVPETLVGRSYIIVNPNVGELAPERGWPLEKFEAWLPRFQTLFPALTIVFVGKGAKEAAAGRRLQTQAVNAIDLTDRLSLQQLIGCIQGAQLVVTADTSILHLAGLTDTRILALFGPTLEQTYFPPAAAHRSIVVSEEVFCRPCVHHWPAPPCAGNNLCMQKILVEDIVTAAQALLQTEVPPPQFRLPTSSDDGDAQDMALGVVYRRSK